MSSEEDFDPDDPLLQLYIYKGTPLEQISYSKRYWWCERHRRIFYTICQLGPNRVYYIIQPEKCPNVRIGHCFLRMAGDEQYSNSGEIIVPFERSASIARGFNYDPGTIRRCDFVDDKGNVINTLNVKPAVR
uniref:Uncharacterized protein n=1 Tax=Marseillevirus LCMAC101 TaxID=2506602 RepID=A0A481YSI2_9VIRU|nr:MAG: hypothetical protein LCMAC101_07870 [Marseillevirus LCMAC101]